MWGAGWTILIKHVMFFSDKMDVERMMGDVKEYGSTFSKTALHVSGKEEAQNSRHLYFQKNLSDGEIRMEY